MQRPALRRPDPYKRKRRGKGAKGSGTQQELRLLLITRTEQEEGEHMAKITVYSTTTCPYCKMLKAYLSEKNIAFEDVLLDQQPDQMQASLDTCGSMGVPCTHITKDDGTQVSILGFDREKIDAALDIQANISR